MLAKKVYKSLILVFLILSFVLLTGCNKKEEYYYSKVFKWDLNTKVEFYEIDYLTYNAEGEDIGVAPGVTNTVGFAFSYGTKFSKKPDYPYLIHINTHFGGGGSVELCEKLLWKLDDGKFGTYWELFDSINRLCGSGTGKGGYRKGELPPLNEMHTITWKWPLGTDDELDTNLGTNELLSLPAIVIMVDVERWAN